MKRLRSIICLVAIVVIAMGCTNTEVADLGPISDDIIEINWNSPVKDFYFPVENLEEGTGAIGVGLRYVKPEGVK